MWCSIFIFFLLSMVICVLLFSYYSLYKKNKEIIKNFYFDELTKLHNKKYLKDKIEEQAEYYHVIVADIDKFKNINDTYGHLTGDRVLRFFAKSLQNDLKPAPTHLIRYGGEEFILFYDNQKYSDIEVVGFVNDFRKELANKKIQIDKNLIDNENLYKIKDSIPIINITASFGVTTNLQITTLEEKIKIADGKLYEAKNKGRNTVCSEIGIFNDKNK